AGLINEFPVATACGSDWAFMPMSGDPGATLVQPDVSPGTCQPGIAQLNLVDGSLTQNFEGIRYGDCTGNWQPSQLPPPTPTPSDSPTEIPSDTPTPTASL